MNPNNHEYFFNIVSVAVYQNGIHMSTLPGFLFHLKEDVDRSPQGLMGPPAPLLLSPLKSKPPNQAKDVGGTEVAGLRTLESGKPYQYIAEDGSLWVVDPKTNRKIIIIKWKTVSQHSRVTEVNDNKCVHINFSSLVLFLSLP